MEPVNSPLTWIAMGIIYVAYYAIAAPVVTIFSIWNSL